MANSNRGEKFLSDFKQFLSFLKNLWGLLAGISVFFPFSNVFLKLIPVCYTQDDPSGGWSYISVGVITAFTMLVIVFILLWTYGQRDHFRKPVFRLTIHRRAWAWFLTGIICLIGYIGMHEIILLNIYFRIGLTHGDSGRYLGDILLLLVYSGFFAFMTRAFVLLAMKEYFKSHP